MSSASAEFKLQVENLETGEFVPFDITKVEKVEPKQISQPPQSEGFNGNGEAAPQSEFHVPEWYWKSLTTDPFIKSQLEKIVELQVTGLVDARLKAVQDEARQKAEKEGYEKGNQQAQAENAQKFAEEKAKFEAEKTAWAEEAKQTVAKLTDEIMVQKQHILSDHEARWSRALLHILRRFHVGKAHPVTYAITDWVNDCLKEFKQKGKIFVYVPKDEHAKYQEAVGSDFSQNKWELAIDESLKPGQIRCDCGEGGLLFTQNFEEKELERLIEGALTQPNATTA